MTKRIRLIVDETIQTTHVVDVEDDFDHEDQDEVEALFLSLDEKDCLYLHITERDIDVTLIPTKETTDV